MFFKIKILFINWYKNLKKSCFLICVNIFNYLYLLIESIKEKIKQFTKKLIFRKEQFFVVAKWNSKNLNNKLKIVFTYEEENIQKYIVDNNELEIFYLLDEENHNNFYNWNFNFFVNKNTWSKKLDNSNILKIHDNCIVKINVNKKLWNKLSKIQKFDINLIPKYQQFEKNKNILNTLELISKMSINDISNKKAQFVILKKIKNIDKNLKINFDLEYYAFLENEFSKIWKIEILNKNNLEKNLTIGIEKYLNLNNFFIVKFVNKIEISKIFNKDISIMNNKNEQIAIFKYFAPNFF